MKKIQHFRLKNEASHSAFGLLKFDENGFLIEPELNEEQRAAILAIPGFSELVDEEDKDDMLENAQDSLEHKEIPEELKELKNVLQLKKYAKDHNIEIQGSKKEEVLAEIIEALE